jgi:hypothetical protein
MGARRQLNRAFFNGSLLLAAAAGALTGSWLVFGLALAVLVAVLVAGNLYLGEIRPSRCHR